MRRKNDAQREVEGVAQRLRKERPEASPLDLDRIKTSAMAHTRSGSGGRAGARRLAVVGLTVGLLAATTGSVLAGGGSGSSSSNAAVAQYGNNCDTNNNNGEIGSGNGNGNGNGNGGGNGGNGGNSGGHGYSATASWSGGGGGGGNGGNGGNGNGSGNGNENGNGNGNESGNGNNNYNCNENSFNTTEITNNYAGDVVNNYTVVNAAPSGSVLGSKTSKKATTSSRRIKIHVRVPRGAKVRRVTIKVNGKHLKTIRGKKASANVELVNLPCSSGATKIEVSITLSDGKTVTAKHSYHLCVA
jgi:hypothetical protein